MWLSIDPLTVGVTIVRNMANQFWANIFNSARRQKSKSLAIHWP